MKRDLITREQAVEMVGEDAVDRVERENCEPTNRVGYNGASHNNDLYEWSASVSCQDKYGVDCWLVAYYYTTNEQDEVIAKTGDGASIDWVVAGYEVV